MLKFASQEEALQHLSNLTGKKIKIAAVTQYNKEDIKNIQGLSPVHKKVIEMAKFGEFAVDPKPQFKLNIFNQEGHMFATILLTTNDEKYNTSANELGAGRSQFSLEKFKIYEFKVYLKGGETLSL